jgi:NADPH:quinone reductase
VRAARCEAFGGPENIRLREVPAPQARPGHVVVDVAAAAVNFPDLLFVADRYQVSLPVPFTIGSEFSGHVSAVGSDGGGFSVGDRVFGSVPSGAMAEQVLAPTRKIALVPAGLSMTEAAAFRITFTTAYLALVSAGRLEPGQWVVVLGAAGGVGTAAVDIAVRLGARVIAAASSPARLRACRSLGAEVCVDYTTEDLKARIKHATGAGADLVIDPVGDQWAEPALRALRWGGSFVTLGYAGGQIPRIPLNLVLLKNVTLRGLEMSTWVDRQPEEAARARAGLAKLVTQGLRPMISEVHDLQDVAAAYQRVEKRLAAGKVVIRVAG